MTELLTQNESYIELFASVDIFPAEPKWLTERRQEALARFQRLGFPTQKQEDWRFTNLAPLADTVFALPTRDDLPCADVVGDHTYRGFNGGVFVFVDGVFVRELSTLTPLPKGVFAGSLRDALETNEALVKEHLSQLTDNESAPFSALNDAFVQDGFVLAIPANTVIEEPIQVLYLTTGSSVPTMSTLHNLFIFEQSSQATMVEKHASLGEGNYFKNIVTEVYSGKNSNVDHYKIQLEGDSATHISTLRLYQERDSYFRSHTIDFGALLVRNNLWGKLDGEGCEAVLNGLYMLRGKQHVDNHMWMEHVKENIPSHELYKGILDDESSAVFTGRIFVHKEAQKTDAKQTNQNLLLSDNARVNTKPQLEIYADDVKCTHGATIGQMDPMALFYLMSRAIDRDTARHLLVQAFAGDITERIRLEPVRESVNKILAKRLK